MTGFASILASFIPQFDDRVDAVGVGQDLVAFVTILLTRFGPK